MKKRVPVTEYPKAEMLPEPLSKFIDYSNIRMPSMNRFITESVNFLVSINCWTSSRKTTTEFWYTFK